MREPNQPVELVRFLARPGADHGTLSIAAGGGQLMFTVKRAQLLIAIESAAEALRRMDDPKVNQ